MRSCEVGFLGVRLLPLSSAARYAGGSEATAVQHLVDEALTAGVERALEPALLQSAALDRMLPAR